MHMSLVAKKLWIKNSHLNYPEKANFFSFLHAEPLTGCCKAANRNQNSQTVPSKTNCSNQQFTWSNLSKIQKFLCLIHFTEMIVRNANVLLLEFDDLFKMVGSQRIPCQSNWPFCFSCLFKLTLRHYTIDYNCSLRLQRQSFQILL